MNRSGALYLVLIGALLALSGGAFTWLMWRSFDRALGQDNWARVPCRIVRSEVLDRQIGPDSPVEFGYGVTYHYEFDGASYSSEILSLRGSPWSSHSEPAEGWKARFPVDSEQTCHVNPADPAQAVLETDSKGPGYSLWFPILFVVGGLVMMANAVRAFLRGAGSTGGDLDEKSALAGLAEGAPEEQEGEGEVEGVQGEGPDKV